MAVLGRTVDRWGRPVELTDAGWQHVLKGHKELASRKADILIAVEQADLVYLDADNAARETFYRVIADQGTAHPLYVKVCVEFGSGGGAVITAYLTRRLKPTEERRWP